MKRVTLWMDCKPTTAPACLYASDVSYSKTSLNAVLNESLVNHLLSEKRS